MNIVDAVRVSLADLYYRRFRTALATLGIVFGVAAVQAMLCIGEGAKQEALDGIARLGVDKIFIRSELLEEDVSDSDSESDTGSVERRGLLLRDQFHIRQHFKHIEQVIAVRDLRSTLFSIQGQETTVSVMATNSMYQKLASARMKKGRFLHSIDEEYSSTVCVVGEKAARSLFYFEDPINQHINILGQQFTVVGVLENYNNTNSISGTDLSEMLFIPISTAMYLSGDMYFDKNDAPIPQLDAIIIDCASSENVEAIAERVKRWLEKEGRLADCTIQIPLAVMKQQESTKRIFSLVMTTIASISLLVGGIGIMNIMLANVSERRREIGTRRALGATRFDIMFQFSFEASVLSAFGGLLGIAVGYGLTIAVTHYAGWPVLITLGNISVGFIAAVVTGVLFGWWPARQASLVVPIEALRAV
jgi:putative ABC transport system permease protein